MSTPSTRRGPEEADLLVRDTPTPAAILAASDISAGYGRGTRSAIVLRDVTFSVSAGRTIGVVGESGSGKSTLAKVLIGQLPTASGEVRLAGRDLAQMRTRERQTARRAIQLIPQDPYSSLDPRMKIGSTLAEAIDPHRGPNRIDRTRITDLLEMVSLEGDAANRLPHEFSGGQRQRIVIARALAVQPQVLIADEVTSALDSSVQAEILNLILRLQRDRNLAIVFITHDLSVARYMCDEISVLYLGRVAEQGPIGVLADPAHPYTRLLRDSVPDPSGRMFQQAPPAVVASEPGDPAHPPAGCAFHVRCPIGPRLIPDRTRCSTEVPLLQKVQGPDWSAACHFPLVPEVDA